MKEIKVNEYWMKLYTSVETAVEDFAVLLDFLKVVMLLKMKHKLLTILPCNKLKMLSLKVH
jgi:hypothetical protein